MEQNSVADWRQSSKRWTVMIQNSGKRGWSGLGRLWRRAETALRGWYYYSVLVAHYSEIGSIWKLLRDEWWLPWAFHCILCASGQCNTRGQLLRSLDSWSEIREHEKRSHFELRHGGGSKRAKEWSRGEQKKVQERGKGREVERKKERVV